MQWRNMCDNMGPNFWELSDQEFIVSDQLLARQSLDTPLPNYNRPQKDLKERPTAFTYLIRSKRRLQQKNLEIDKFLVDEDRAKAL